MGTYIFQITQLINIFEFVLKVLFVNVHSVKQTVHTGS